MTRTADTAQLNADVIALKAANQRLRATLGSKRFKEAQAALSAETGGHGISEAPADDGSDIIALARSLGIAGIRPATQAQAGLTADEHADLQILRKAGYTS